MVYPVLYRQPVNSTLVIKLRKGKGKTGQATTGVKGKGKAGRGLYHVFTLEVGFSHHFRKWWFHLGVSKNMGTPKWMVKIMENPSKMDDLGVPLFLE